MRPATSNDSWVLVTLCTTPEKRSASASGLAGCSGSTKATRGGSGAGSASEEQPPSSGSAQTMIVNQALDTGKAGVDVIGAPV
jgi:hypothetical protein